jgi:hypothetical protein
MEGVSRTRLLQFGKAALATVLAIDAAGGLESSPPSFLASRRKLMPGWAISLLAFALLAPALAAALDGFARARRRGRLIGGWARWALAAAVPFLVTLAAAYIFELLDWLPQTASEALSPTSRPSFAESAPALGGLALVFALSWLLLRPLVAGSARESERPRGPEPALAHLCVLFALPDGSRRPPLGGLMLLGAGLVPVLVALYYGARFDLGLDPTRYTLLFLAGGGSVWSVIIASLIAGSLLSIILIALTRREPRPLPEITVRGPRTYAGPGSLGGTESAFRR